MTAELTRYRLRHRARPIDVWVAGDGPPIVLLHGWGLSGRVYRDAVLAIASRGYRVAAPSLAVAESWKMDMIAEMAAEAMAGVDAAPAPVLGHSFGGAVGVTLAVQHPDFVRAVVPISAPLVSLGTRGMGKVVLPGRHFRIVTHAPAAAALLRAATTRGGIGSLARAARWVIGNGQDPRLETLAATDIPRAVVWAEEDSLLSPEVGRRAAEVLACTFHLIGGGNGWNGTRLPDHDWPMRHPEHFADTILRILGSLLPADPDYGLHA
ncbi:MAG TPA: alpha/beta hydrolase [Actinomycetota bacterium]|jgi:pimeloyl-ACP methyl ester carboxylesterase